MNNNTSSFSIVPLRASYGEKDNMHALLSCSGDAQSLPSTLAGFTDKPQGHLGPGERWWPSVGCGAFDQWWAIWWSVADHEATRAGMARAEVALWPIDKIADIDDIGKVMELLNGGAPVPKAGPDILASVAQALIRGGEVPVVPNLDTWPGILSGLWPRLWPQARREFSAWVVLSPPQVGDLEYTPWLYAVPSGREKQWPSQLIVQSSSLQDVTRGARWLMGEHDQSIDDLIIECPFPDGSPSRLTRIARAAERLDKVRTSPDAASGIDLARTLAAIAPTPNSAARYKAEALHAVRMHLATAPLSAIRALANLNAEHYLPAVLPSASLEQWVMNEFPTLAPTDQAGTISVFISKNAELWWLEAFEAGLRAGLKTLQQKWSKVVLLWMCKLPDVSALLLLMSEPEKLETCVIDVIGATSMAAEQFDAVRRASHILGWSRMHSVALWLSMSPKDAFAQQLRFPKKAETGIELLIERASDDDLLSSAVLLREDSLLSAAARRSIAKPLLLKQMDLGNAGWQRFWVIHLDGNGIAWPKGVDRNAQLSRLLQSILLGHYESGPISRLPDDVASAALDFPERKQLWARLSASESQMLLQATARIVLKKIGNGDDFPTPERPLLAAIILQAGQVALSAVTIVKLISWHSAVDEQTVQSWVKHASCTKEAGRQLGRIIHAKSWKDIARDLHSRFLLGEKEVFPALNECKALLSWWSQLLIYDPGSLSGSSLTLADLVRRAGDLGGDLAPFSLDDMWVRAKGKPKVLQANGTPAERWRQAAHSAESGSLPGGILALVEVLIDDFPYNGELVELRRELQRLARNK